MTATTVSMINMKGGVGKTTLSFNLAWYAAWMKKLRVLAVDLDPQSNLSQYFMGAERYREFISKKENPTVVDIFEQFSPPTAAKPSPSLVDPSKVVFSLHKWDNGGLLDLIPCRLELSWTLKNSTDKSHLLPRFLSKISNNYDLIIIDCAPTESILTTAAYLSSRYVVVPVKPEFLAIIGLPLLERSLREHTLLWDNQKLEMAGIIFNDSYQQKIEHNKSRAEVKSLAKDFGWYIFNNEAYHSDSYAAGARSGTAIFQTDYARGYVKQEFFNIGDEFLSKVGL